MLTVGLLAALLGPWEPTPIVGGEPVVGDAWRSTVVIDLGVDLCTGTLVSDRVVLTAAHCVQSSPPAELLQVKIGNTRADPELALAVERYAIHPDFCANIFECEQDLHDFAYLLLAEPAPADAVVARMITDQDTWDATMVTGAPVTLVGFGYDQSLEDGIKREVEDEIRGFTRSGLEFLAGGDGKDGCQGDSGGPAYVRRPSGEELLVGVLSRGRSCGEGGYYGTTPTASCWLLEELAQDEAVAAFLDPDDTACSIDTDPTRSDERGCSIAGDREGMGGAGGLLLLIAAAARRRGATRRTLRARATSAARTPGGGGTSR